MSEKGKSDVIGYHQQMASHPSFLSGYGSPQSPFRLRSVTHSHDFRTDFKGKSAIASATDPLDSPIILQPEDLETSNFQEALRTGCILPNPLTHTGWYALKVPRNITRTPAFWVTVYNYLGSFSETAFELYNLRLVSRQLSLIATHSMQRSDLIQYPTYKVSGMPTDVDL